MGRELGVGDGVTHRRGLGHFLKGLRRGPAVGKGLREGGGGAEVAQLRLHAPLRLVLQLCVCVVCGGDHRGGCPVSKPARKATPQHLRLRSVAGEDGEWVLSEGHACESRVCACARACESHMATRWLCVTGPCGRRGGDVYPV
eukprot:1196233-Prorocentrum_minimum.AAC.5